VAVRELLNNLRQGQLYESAFFSATGIWPDEFENEWLRSTSKSVKLSIFKDWDFYFGIVAVPLLFLGGILMFFRQRRIKKQWEQEEQEYFDYDDY
jgi:hypothetical protein